jgi:superfamily II DNA or RNA helicase
VVVDEAHHTTAGTWSKVIEHFSQAKLLGVTATPIRGDGRGLGEHYQCMVEGPTAQRLTDDGFLAAAKVLAPPGFDSTGLRKRMGDFDTKQAEQRVGTIMGDCLSHYRRHLPGQTAIAFCCSVAHAESVAALFQSAGIAAASIDGSMNTVQRRRLLADLGTGRLKVLTSCALIGEGVDVPSVGGCILLRPTASVGLHLQMIGRCLRPQPGKRAVVLDHVGNTLRIGHHLEPREWTLDGLAKRDRDKAPSVKVCPQCFAAMASQVRQCLECGHQFAPEVRELQQVEGELQELKPMNQSSLRYRMPVEVYFGSDEGWMSGFVVSRYSIEKVNGQYVETTIGVEATQAGLIGLGDQMEVNRSCVRPDGQAVKREQGTAQTLDDLRQLAQQRGYKRGWAERVYQARLAKRYGM